MVKDRTNSYVVWGDGISSPGATIVLKEIGRSSSTVRYRLQAKGLPFDKTYSILSYPVTVDAPQVTMSDIIIDHQGFALCRGTPGQTTEPGQDDYVDLVVIPAKGEPYRFGLVSSDGLHAFQKVVPIPNQSSDKSCGMQSVLLFANSELVFIEGTGFKPHSEVEMMASSEGESHNNKLMADGDGLVRASLLPYVKGHDKGMMTVVLKSPECSPQVSFPWGKGVNKPQ